MKKKFLAVLLALVMVLLLTGCGCDHEWQEATCTTAKTCPLCGEVEGAPLGHVWQAVTCEHPKTCTVCNLTEGEALGHDWQEATTEAPKTCANCKLTEGERIITDPRFTTASTKFLHGTWVCDVNMTAEMMGLPMGFPNGVDCIYTMEFSNDGELTSTLTMKDKDTFTKDYREYLIEYTYLSLELQGVNREDADAAMEQVYGMNVTEYIDATMKSMDIGAIMQTMFQSFNYTEVYFVQDGKICTAMSWKSTMIDDSTYTFENGILTIDELVLEEGGKPLQFKRPSGPAVQL
jgi:hypothetical protein